MELIPLIDSLALTIPTVVYGVRVHGSFHVIVTKAGATDDCPSLSWSMKATLFPCEDASYYLKKPQYQEDCLFLLSHCLEKGTHFPRCITGHEKSRDAPNLAMVPICTLFLQRRSRRRAI